MVCVVTTLSAWVLSRWPTNIDIQNVLSFTTENPQFGWILVFLISLHFSHRILLIRKAWLTLLFVSLKSLVNICASGHWIPFANSLSSEPHSLDPSDSSCQMNIYEYLLSTSSVPAGSPKVLFPHLVTIIVDHTLTKSFPHRTLCLIPFE